MMRNEKMVSQNTSSSRVKSQDPMDSNLIRRRRFLQLLAAAGVVAGSPLAHGTGFTSPADTRTKRKPLIRDIAVGYLLDCNFWALSPYINPADIRLSGWDTEMNGGSMDYSPKNEMSLDWFKLVDTSEKKPVVIRHQVARQAEGPVTLEYRFKLPSRMDGAAWELRDLEQAGVRLVTSGANLCFEDHAGKLEVIQSYEPGREYGVKVVADITRHTFSAYVDGDLRVKEAEFRYPVKTIDEVLVKTGDAARGELFLAPVNLYKGYRVCETFVTAGVGKVPADWSADLSGGTVAVEEFACSSKPDIFSMRLENTKSESNASLQKQFIPIGDKTVLEFRFLLPEKVDGARMDLCEGEKAALRLCTHHGDLCSLDSQQSPQKVAANLRANLWYMVKIVADPSTSTADVFVNGKLAAHDASFMQSATSFDRIEFATGSSGQGVMWLDDVLVYPFQEYPADYVPKPEPCPAESPYILGVQSAPIHREGVCYTGWDWVQRNREPFLGWYDEGSPEVSDWEIKWQVEHGIEYELYCWYRPNSGFGNPIKEGPCDGAIIKGLFNARYSHLKKFAIMYEDQQGDIATWGKTDPEDFKNNIIPYWIEYFFKDPRYFLIDGKPLLSIYSVASFIKNFGGVEGARKGLATLREQCIQAGFPGVVILTEERDAEVDLLTTMKSIGADYCYAYTWTAKDRSTQRKRNQAESAAAASAGLGMLPMLSVGWETSNWDGPKGPGWLSASEYRKQALWLKNEFMPSLPADSLGRRMLMLDNWNEFGEGHWIMPSRLVGFGYLDALRDVFTAGGAHKDVVPTEQQKRRFTVLYPKD